MSGHVTDHVIDYLDVTGDGLVERGHLLVEESSLGSVGLCSRHSQQLVAMLVLMENVIVQPDEAEK